MLNILRNKIIHTSSSFGPVCPVTLAFEFIWLKSAATPGVCAISYNDKWDTNGLCFISRDIGWPIPPLAPNIATLACR